MGLIIKDIELIGDKGKRKLEALFDTGASRSFIKRRIAKEIATVIKLPHLYTFTLGDGAGKIESQEEVVLDMKIKGYSLLAHFIVIDRLARDFIVGADTLQIWKIKLDPENEDVLIDKKALEMILV